MYSTERRIVQATWAQLAPHAAAVAALFYTRLFQLDPSLRALFARADMAEQGKKLTQMLAVAVASLDRLEQLLPALEALALGLGPAFTAEARAAWTTVYVTLAGVMRRAAAEQHAVPSLAHC